MPRFELFPKMRAFIKILCTNPRSIGAIIPSSHFLAKSMGQCISKNNTGLILELGPGTGAITKGILESGVAPDKLTLVELSPAFAQQLSENFPGISVIQGDAIQLSALLENKKFDSIVSSLPLRLLSEADCKKILSEISTVLIPNGKFIQFTYAIFSRETFYPKNFKLEKSFIEWRNVPPARVDVFAVV